MIWNGGYLEIEQNNTMCLSIVFSWELQKAYQRAIYWRNLGYNVVAGGPAVDYQPEILQGVATLGKGFNALPYHNPDATFTTRGCIRHCKFCVVPTIEGDFRELPDYNPKPIVCDNNFLASSRRHFDKVIDSLKPLQGIDFNQGLDARLLAPYHAQRLAELNLKCVRLAWDNTSLESVFRTAFTTLLSAGIPKSLIRVYVLMGFDDTPDDALYRLTTVRDLGALPFPMRYQEPKAIKRNSFIGEHWTGTELRRFMEYWSHLIYLRPIPFEEYVL